MLLSEKDTTFYSRFLYQGEVITNDDPFDAGIITVRIPEIDQNIPNSSLAPCYPISNYQFIRIKPKVGERVFILFDKTLENTDIRNNQEIRYWLGLKLSNITNINNSQFFFNSNSHESNGWITNKKELKNIKFSKELELGENDISIRGRDNSDIILKSSELLLRVGRHVSNIPPLFNNVNPSYIQLKYKNDLIINEDTQVDVNVPNNVQYIFYVSRIDLNVLIKIYSFITNKIEETFSKSYLTEQELKIDVSSKIANFKRQYNNWQIKTDNIDFLENNQYKVNNDKITKKADRNPAINNTINIVADKINLLSHKSSTVNLSSNGEYIDEINQSEIDEIAQRLVKGDELINFLKLVVSFLNNHKHPYNNMSAVNDILLQKINQYDLENLVNNHIKLL